MSFDRRCILVVDDTIDARELYAEYLSFCGYHPVQAANGLEAIERAAECRPLAIIMDLAMPILDGWEATRILKRDPRFKLVPILAVTGNTLPEHIHTALEAGAVAVLRKPCTPANLLSALEHAVRGEAVPSSLCSI